MVELQFPHRFVPLFHIRYVSIVKSLFSFFCIIEVNDGLFISTEAAVVILRSVRTFIHFSFYADVGDMALGSYFKLLGNVDMVWVLLRGVRSH